jgi:hypothetical protein
MKKNHPNQLAMTVYVLIDCDPVKTSCFSHRPFTSLSSPATSVDITVSCRNDCCSCISRADHNMHTLVPGPQHCSSFAFRRKEIGTWSRVRNLRDGCGRKRVQHRQREVIGSVGTCGLRMSNMNLGCIVILKSFSFGELKLECFFTLVISHNFSGCGFKRRSYY